MTVIAGIDEAGLGPVLGPLVVSATAFNIPAEMVDMSMWQLLSSCVSRKAPRRATRIPIADSKKLYSSQKENGIEHLERGVLTMLATMDKFVTCLADLLRHVSPATLGCIHRYPWYNQESLDLPRRAGATGISLCANALGFQMDQVGMSRPLAMRSEVILEGEYNSLIQATDNKSVTLFDVTSRLLSELWNLSAGQDMKVFVDRQGGRMRYLPSLQRIFEGCQFKVLDESDRASAYRIQDGRRTVEIYFLVEAEDQHLPVALASMLSKYLRELFMELFNRFWGRICPQIAPTAGYHTDGNRFYREIQPQVKQMGLDESMLYRSR